MPVIRIGFKWLTLCIESVEKCPYGSALSAVMWGVHLLWCYRLYPLCSSSDLVVIIAIAGALLPELHPVCSHKVGNLLQNPDEHIKLPALDITATTSSQKPTKNHISLLAQRLPLMMGHQHEADETCPNSSFAAGNILMSECSPRPGCQGFPSTQWAAAWSAGPASGQLPGSRRPR